MKIRVFACAMDKLYKLDRRGLIKKHWLRRSFLIILWPFLVIDNSCYLAERFFAGILSWWNSSFVFRIGVVWSFVPTHELQNRTLHVDLEQVEATRQQQCEALVQQIKQPLLAAWDKIHFIICNWLVESTNLFGFVAVLFADFDRLWLPR